jgi:hypothetical protein
MDQVTIKYTNILHCRTIKIYPNLDFWFENKPSGNPAWQSYEPNPKYLEFCFKVLATFIKTHYSIYTLYNMYKCIS